MHDAIILNLKLVTRTVEIIGGSALIVGFVIATMQWFRQFLQLGKTRAVAAYRQALGRIILIGLEVLVAATIIKTITLEPTLESIGFLAIMIAIRTFLGWTTTLEISGRWPWQRPVADAARSPTKS